MNKFDFYLDEGQAKKQMPDFELASSLVLDAESRFGNVTKLDMKIFHKNKMVNDSAKK